MIQQNKFRYIDNTPKVLDGKHADWMRDIIS